MRFVRRRAQCCLDLSMLSMLSLLTIVETNGRKGWRSHSDHDRRGRALTCGPIGRWNTSGGRLGGHDGR